jgi:hypothetical protein
MAAVILLVMAVSTTNHRGNYIMISDVLSKTVDDLDNYLNDPFWDKVYSGELRERIIRLREEVDEVRVLIDGKPGKTREQATNANDPHDIISNRRELLDWMKSEESARTPPFFSQKDLLERGWRNRLIAELLGEPDWKSPNPHYPNTPPMLCWRQARVLAAEATPAFQKRVREGGVDRQ